MADEDPANAPKFRDLHSKTNPSLGLGRFELHFENGQDVSFISDVDGIHLLQGALQKALLDLQSGKPNEGTAIPVDAVGGGIGIDVDGAHMLLFLRNGANLKFQLSEGFARQMSEAATQLLPYYQPAPSGKN
ncbi:hypothetical protein [Methylopila sp. 73B]|uniref:hypothetical protein n=1 Tax=Methylopila sp. 73B TaxID=1120792 RepID=UPI0012DF5D1B|nr:hypothetical protein [Methylopila sp. 73B]